MSNPFQPITKANAATVLDVSLRTIDSWVASGLMPAPQHIGRHVYWHPEAFYEWLDASLRPRQVVGKTRSEPPNRDAATNAVNGNQQGRRQNAHRGSVNAARQRDEERLEKINAAASEARSKSK